MLVKTINMASRHLKPPKFENIFVAVIPFFPFFCTNNYYTSLLLIVCALRWYIKSLYRHLFLVDISKSARVTHFLICGKDNSKASWATHPQIGQRVAKARSCETDESKKIFRWTPPELWRRDHRNCVGGRQISVISPLLNTITLGGGGGGSPEFFFASSVSQLRALATLRPIWGRVAQGAFELSLPQIRKCHFLEWPLHFWIYLLRKDAYRDFLYIILKHTQ